MSLFPGAIVYHSQPVAWILGETLEAARLGAARVQADYKLLPAVLTIEDAIAAGSFHSAPMRIVRGDAERDLAHSPHRIEGELDIGGQEHFYLETQCSLAWLDESAGVAVESSTQHPNETQELVSHILRLANTQIT